MLSIWPSWVSYCLEIGDGIGVAGQRQQGWTVWELDPGRWESCSQRLPSATVGDPHLWAGLWAWESEEVG